MLGELGRVFAEHGVSIASVLQQAHPERSGSADLIATTHTCRRGAVEAVLADLAGSESVIDVGVRLWMESEEDGSR